MGISSVVGFGSTLKGLLSFHACPDLFCLNACEDKSQRMFNMSDIQSGCSSLALTVTDAGPVLIFVCTRYVHKSLS